MKQTFDEKQQKLQVNGNNVMICLDEEEVVTDDTTKYQYNVEAFTLSDGQTLKEEVRNHMLYLINEYDHSNRVDGFYVGGKLMWLDFEWRQKIRERINTDEEDGKAVSNFLLCISTPSRLYLSLNNGIRDNAASLLFTTITVSSTNLV